jgi:hypothetical protein
MEIAEGNFRETHESVSYRDGFAVQVYTVFLGNIDKGPRTLDLFW